MLQLLNNELVFSFPGVHEKLQARVHFQRTLRIPDDNKTYPLPPGLGKFPVRHVDTYKDRLPEEWRTRGGVFLPLYQSEALWLRFSGSDVGNRGIWPVAIKIAAGKINAVSGDLWEAGLKEKGYVVLPKQPWLDGYSIGKGVIRQFVAVPLGGGFTAEEQLTKKAEFGGIQIECFPMKREVFERRFPERSRTELFCCETMSFDSERSSPLRSKGLSMGLGAGGKMKQEIFEDTFGLNDWDLEHGSRVFVHLANSMLWREVTQEDPPTVPFTASDYTRRGLPWFDYYRDDPALDGSTKLAGLKTVQQVSEEKGVPVILESVSVEIPDGSVKHIGPQKRPGEVTDGRW